MWNPMFKWPTCIVTCDKFHSGVWGLPQYMIFVELPRVTLAAEIGTWPSLSLGVELACRKYCSGLWLYLGYAIVSVMWTEPHEYSNPYRRERP